MLGFVFVLLFSGCDALKSLYGEVYGEDDGSVSGGDGGVGFGGGSRDGGGNLGDGGGGFDSGSGDGNGNRIDGGSGDGGGNRIVSVSFDGIMVDGNGTTTLVSLVFGSDIDGLSDRDVRVDGGDTGATGGALVRTETGTYTLAVSGVKAPGEIAVTVGKSGWSVNPATRTAQVSFIPGLTLVTFGGMIPNGTAGLATTTELALTFNPGIPLEEGDITLSAGSTGATMGALSGSGTTYTLGLDNVTEEGEVGVTVVKDGYTVSPATVAVPAYYYPVALAAGGTVTFLPVDDNPAQIWEIHTFAARGSYSFSYPGNSSVTADYLIVAGGGGAGGGSWWAGGGGGGAGGLLYKTGQTLALEAGSATVIVGAGGAGGAKITTGKNGEKSAIGNVEVPGGGGGGASRDENVAYAGIAGGSGGGGGCGYHVTSGGGAGSAYGYAGGASSKAAGQQGDYGGGGGGGGAGGTGKPGYIVAQTTVGGGGAGGAAWNATDTGAPWIKTATGTDLFSGGGKGGNFGNGAIIGAAAGPNYGDGGSGGTGQPAGGAGHSGIVVIRFQRPK
jgi:hypothetical protein